MRNHPDAANVGSPSAAWSSAVSKLASLLGSAASAVREVKQHTASASASSPTKPPKVRDYHSAAAVRMDYIRTGDVVRVVTATKRPWIGVVKSCAQVNAVVTSKLDDREYNVDVKCIDVMHSREPKS